MIRENEKCDTFIKNGTEWELKGDNLFDVFKMMEMYFEVLKGP